VSLAWNKYQIIVDQVEGHISIGCDLGTSFHIATISAYSTLRKRIIFKGEGMLGTDPNPSWLFITYKDIFSM
jgi:hypothetical protein